MPTLNTARPVRALRPLERAYVAPHWEIVLGGELSELQEDEECRAVMALGYRVLAYKPARLRGTPYNAVITTRLGRVEHDYAARLGRIDKPPPAE